MRHTFFLTLAIVALQGMTFSGMQAAAEAEQTREEEQFPRGQNRQEQPYYYQCRYIDPHENCEVHLFIPHLLLTPLPCSIGDLLTYYEQHNTFPEIPSSGHYLALENDHQATVTNEEASLTFGEIQPLTSSKAEGLVRYILHCLHCKAFALNQDYCAHVRVRLWNKERGYIQEYLVPRNMVKDSAAVGSKRGNGLLTLVDLGRGIPKTIYSAESLITPDEEGAKFRDHFTNFMQLITRFGYHASEEGMAYDSIRSFVTSFLNDTQYAPLDPFSLLYSFSYVIKHRRAQEASQEGSSCFSQTLETMGSVLYVASDLGKSRLIRHFNGIEKSVLKNIIEQGTHHYFLPPDNLAPRFPARPRRDEEGNPFGHQRRAEEFVKFSLRHYGENALSDEEAVRLEGTIHEERDTSTELSSFGLRRRSGRPAQAEEPQGFNMQERRFDRQSIPPREFLPGTSLEVMLSSYTSDVQGIDLSGNSISHIPARAFERFRNLRILILSGCEIESIDPNAFKIGEDSIEDTSDINEHDCLLSEHSPLLMLDLSHNNLTSLHPDTFIWASRLRYLDISHNPLSGLTPDFSYLPELRNLNMAFTQYEELTPHAFWANNNLLVLDLSSNTHLSMDVSQLHPLTHLTMLFLNGVQLRGVEEALDQRTKRVLSRLLLFSGDQQSREAQMLTQFVYNDASQEAHHRARRSVEEALGAAVAEQREDQAALERIEQVKNDLLAQRVCRPSAGLIIRLREPLSLRWLENTVESGARWMYEQGLVSAQLCNDVIAQVAYARHKRALKTHGGISQLFHQFSNKAKESLTVTAPDIAGTIAAQHNNALYRFWLYGRYAASCIVSDSYTEERRSKSERCRYFVSEQGQKTIEASERAKARVTLFTDAVTAIGFIYGAGVAASVGGLSAGAFYVGNAVISQLAGAAFSVVTPYITGSIGGALTAAFGVANESELLSNEVFRGALIAGILRQEGITDAIGSEDVLSELRRVADAVSGEVSPHIESQINNLINRSGNEIVERIAEEQARLTANASTARSHLMGSAAAGVALVALPMVSKWGIEKWYGAEKVLKQELEQAQAGLQILPLLGMSIEVGATVVGPLALILDAYADHHFLASCPYWLARYEQWSPNTYNIEGDPVAEELPNPTRLDRTRLNTHKSNRIRQRAPFLQEGWNSLPGQGPEGIPNELSCFKEINAVLGGLRTRASDHAEVDIFTQLKKSLRDIQPKQFKQLLRLQGFCDEELYSEKNKEAVNKRVKALSHAVSRVICLLKHLCALSDECVKRTTTIQLHPLLEKIVVESSVFKSESDSADASSDEISRRVTTQLGQALYEVVVQLTAYLRFIVGQLRKETRECLVNFNVFYDQRRSTTPVLVQGTTPSFIAQQDAPPFLAYIFEVIHVLQLMREKLLYLLPSLQETSLRCKNDIRKYLPSDLLAQSYHPTTALHVNEEAMELANQGAADAAGGGGPL